MERLILDVMNVILFYLEDKSKVKLLMLNKKTTKKMYDIIFFDEFYDEKTIIKMTSENIIDYISFGAAARKIYTSCKFFSQQLYKFVLCTNL